MKVARYLVGLALLCSVLHPSAGALAAPTGGVVKSGTATIQQAGGVTTITQSSNNTVIYWTQFNVARGQGVTFIQPSALAIALNRVTGVDPSVILGTITANGRVYLVNPNGVIFGQGSEVNVGALAISTLNASDASFLSGNLALTAASVGAGPIVNQGTLQVAKGGSVLLVAPVVSNEGTIVANLGQVHLAGANRANVTIDEAGLIDVSLPIGAQSADVVVNPALMSQVLTSVFQDRSVLLQDGSVRLVDGSGVVLNAGTIQANGAPGRDAGSVLLQSTQATGQLACGQIEVNGVGSTSSGGVVRLLSRGNTSFDGTLSATGTSGGLIEVSGQTVSLLGAVDTRGSSGKGGELLLDPLNLTIVAKPPGSDDGNLPIILSTTNPNSTNDTVSATALEKVTSGTIVLDATNNITVAGLGGSPIVLAPGVSLSMATQSGSIIFVNPTDSIITSDSGSSAGSIIIQAGTIAGSGGTAALGNLVSTGLGTIQVTADNNISINSLTQGSGKNPSGSFLVESLGGNIQVNGPLLTNGSAALSTGGTLALAPSLGFSLPATLPTDTTIAAGACLKIFADAIIGHGGNVATGGNELIAGTLNGAGNLTVSSNGSLAITDVQMTVLGTGNLTLSSVGNMTMTGSTTLGNLLLTTQQGSITVTAGTGNVGGSRCGSTTGTTCVSRCGGVNVTGGGCTTGTAGGCTTGAVGGCTTGRRNGPPGTAMVLNGVQMTSGGDTTLSALGTGGTVAMAPGSLLKTVSGNLRVTADGTVTIGTLSGGGDSTISVVSTSGDLLSDQTSAPNFQNANLNLVGRFLGSPGTPLTVLNVGNVTLTDSGPATATDGNIADFSNVRGIGGSVNVQGTGPVQVEGILLFPSAGGLPPAPPGSPTLNGTQAGTVAGSTLANGAFPIEGGTSALGSGAPPPVGTTGPDPIGPPPSATAPLAAGLATDSGVPGGPPVASTGGPGSELLSPGGSPGPGNTTAAAGLPSTDPAGLAAAAPVPAGSSPVSPGDTATLSPGSSPTASAGPGTTATQSPGSSPAAPVGPGGPSPAAPLNPSGASPTASPGTHSTGNPSSVPAEPGLAPRVASQTRAPQPTAPGGFLATPPPQGSAQSITPIQDPLGQQFQARFLPPPLDFAPLKMGGLIPDVTRIDKAPLLRRIFAHPGSQEEGTFQNE